MISVVVIGVGSAAILWLSRRSLLHPASHGFYRFFAVEAILALVVLNAPHWFADPLAPHQLVSWLLLVASIVVGVWGVALLHRLGGPRRPAGESPNFEWENTERLVTTGIYRYMRHPMYASLLFLAVGALLKFVSLITLVLAAIATLALAATAKAEEVENVIRFGSTYRDYMRRTSRFVPFVL